MSVIASSWTLIRVIQDVGEAQVGRDTVEEIEGFTSLVDFVYGDGENAPANAAALVGRCAKGGAEGGPGCDVQGTRGRGRSI